MQDQPIADMIFDVPAIVAYCSTFTPLNPGDVIATGTPGGVGLGRTPPVFMKHGDHVEISIGTIGTLRNSVIDEVS
jgi:2-keto-4-pentenoate hydratase/2-oxohepta-3-ene-1,7-dioic acid hydratase in catechol pathway